MIPKAGLLLAFGRWQLTFVRKTWWRQRHLKSRQIFFVACSLVFSALAGPRQSLADITNASFIFTESNEFGDGTDYGSIDIVADSDTGLITFTVDAFEVAEYGVIGDNFGIQAFGFNVQNLTSAPGDWTLGLPTDWTQDNTGGTSMVLGSSLSLRTEPGVVGRTRSCLPSCCLPPAKRLPVISWCFPRE